MVRLGRLLLVLCLAFSGISCVSYPMEKMPLVTDFPNYSKRATKPSAYVTIKFLAKIGKSDEPQVESVAPLPRIRKMIKDISERTSLFQTVSFKDYEATKMPYVLQITILNTGDIGAGNVISAILTGLTLGIIPTRATDHYQFDAELLTKDGTTLGTYRYRESIQTWMGIWMVFLPGENTIEAFDSMMGNMIQTLFRDIHRDQLLTFLQKDIIAKSIVEMSMIHR